MADAPLNPAPKARPLDYAPPAPLIDRVRRYFPSRDQFTGFLKNMVWVAPITLLIWVYAEREQSVTGPPVTVTIEVKTNDPNRVVTLRGPADRNIIVELSGPRAKLERVQNLLTPKPDGAALQVYVDPQIGIGNQELPTVLNINNNPIFKNNGITVKSAQPTYLVVDIDKFDTVEVPVKAPPEVAGLLSAGTRFEPATVLIRAPQAMLEKARGDNQQGLYVYADLSKRTELKTRTGAYVIENVPVYWPSPAPPGQPAGQRKENVFLTPVTVRANLDIKQRDVEFTIPRITVSKITPGGFEESKLVKFDPQITNITVVGPAEQIELLRSKRFTAEATFKLTGLEERNTPTPLRTPLKVELPPGVQVAKDSLKAVEEFPFTVVDR